MINYYLLMKPGIILGNLITFAAGFFLASKGDFHSFLFFISLTGLGCIIGSACVFNNYIDREADKKMERTSKRSLVIGTMQVRSALLFALILFALGNYLLLTFTNPLTAAAANIGFFIYVFIYSFVKSKTTYSTLIGSLSGAIPPVVGYCTVSNRLDGAALLLFFILILWQMPHFFAIGLMHLEDYRRANLCILPVVKGVERTKIHMVLYILFLIPVASLLTFFGYTGYLFFIGNFFIGSAWFYYCLRGLNSSDHKAFGKQMFRLSLMHINAMSLLIPLDVV
jgi:heme o synthase